MPKPVDDLIGRLRFARTPGEGPPRRPSGGRRLRYLALILSLFARSLIAQDLTFTIDATHDRMLIPDSVYGSNELGLKGSTVHRHGGDRHTGFNWENNASNAGTDYLHSSDSYLGDNAGIGSSQAPGALLQAWLNADGAAGLRSIITLPLAGFVAADMNGPVSAGETAPSVRWKEVVVNKPGALSLTPDRSDGSVYLDEMVNYLLVKYGATANGGVAAYCLDNEPALWAEAHPRIHPNATTYTEIVSRDIAAAKMLTRLDPTTQVYGPVLYGWNAHLNLQDAPDASGFNGTYGNFTNYFLAQMKSASESAGRRLLHRYDMHWYPEARGDHRIVFGAGPGTDKDIDARLQAPRSLWDSSYVESSWITQYTTNGEGIRLLPRLQESVDRYYPGTGLALTEYNYGASDHISGGVAQADVLGVLGGYGVAACYWPLNADNSYVAAAFQLYRNYDGAGSAFGSIALDAVTSDNAQSAAHAARAGDGKLTLVAINRSRTSARSAQFGFMLTNGQTITAVKPYRLEPVGGAIVEELPALSGFSAAAFSDTLPAMSATLYEVTTSASAPLTNISTRLHVGTNDTVSIVGFVISGPAGLRKKVLVRGLGPSLGAFGVTDTLPDPLLELQGPGTMITNDNWQTDPNASQVPAGFAPGDPKESAIVATLGPGNYTAILKGARGEAGNGLAEVFDIDQGSSLKLGNISTRGLVQGGDNVMIGGFFIGGAGSASVLVRALGPSLTQFGVQDAMADPVLELHDGNGNQTSNDNWATDRNSGAIPVNLRPTDPRESALLVTLAPGQYTAIVRGSGGEEGVALVEVYNLH